MLIGFSKYLTLIFGAGSFGAAGFLGAVFVFFVLVLYQELYRDTVKGV